MFDSRCPFLPGWGGSSTRAKDLAPRRAAAPQFDFESDQHEWWIMFPFWFPVATSGMPSVAMGLPTLPSFSLRTMLIAATLVAVVLGLIDAAIPSTPHRLRVADW
jgi:hypothetical protein